MKHRECEEIVTDEEAGNTYLFAGTFSFIKTIALNARDPSFLFADLTEGKMPPDEIKVIIMAGLVSLNGQTINESEREEVAINFIERAGLTDASLLCRILLTHALVGDIKKKQISQKEAIQGLMDKIKNRQLNRFRYLIFLSLGLLWGTPLILSGVALFMSLSP